nr:EOG090X09U6 [Sida crystallina]
MIEKMSFGGDSTFPFLPNTLSFPRFYFNRIPGHHQFLLLQFGHLLHVVVRSYFSFPSLTSEKKEIINTNLKMSDASDNEMLDGEVAGEFEDVGDDGDEETKADVKPKNPEELLKAKKRARAQKRLSTMKNKVLRNAQWATLKKEKRKVKKEQQKARKREAEALGDKAPPKQVPRTIESTREHDITTVDPADEEVQFDITHDEYESYFSKTYQPKILITSSDNPHTKTIRFIRELTKIIPNTECFWRKRSSVKKMIKSAKERGYTDVVVINEDRRVPNGMLVSHLPDGPTAYFKVSNVKVTKDLKRDIKEITSHRPEVLLNNFQTRLGQAVGRMLASLFHYDPQFKGRRAVTFHNQRDYIFFRHHRYEFKSAKKAALRELGPRFTLRLRWIQKGTFDTIEGEYEWIIAGKRHEMETKYRTPP